MAKRLGTWSVVAGLASWFLVLGGGFWIVVLMRPDPGSPAPAVPPPVLLHVEPLLALAGYSAIAASVVAVVLGHLARRAGSRQIVGLVAGYVFLAAFVFTVLLPGLAFHSVH